MEARRFPLTRALLLPPSPFLVIEYRLRFCFHTFTTLSKAGWPAKIKKKRHPSLFFSLRLSSLCVIQDTHTHKPLASQPEERTHRYSWLHEVSGARRFLSASSTRSTASAVSLFLLLLSAETAAHLTWTLTRQQEQHIQYALGSVCAKGDPLCVLGTPPFILAANNIFLMFKTQTSLGQKEGEVYIYSLHWIARSSFICNSSNKKRCFLLLPWKKPQISVINFDLPAWHTFSPHDNNFEFKLQQWNKKKGF